jgi:hypothetical protein
MAVSWVVPPCGLLEVHRFIALMMGSKTPEKSVNFTSLHGARTQKTAIFILTAVRTSDHTNYSTIT